MTHTQATASSAATIRRDLADLALELIDRVGVDGAIRYCNSMSWGGVLAQIEAFRIQRLRDG